MGFPSLKTLVLLHLSVLLLSCLNVLGSYESVMSIAQTPHNLPTQPPAQAPQYHHPKHSPAQPPVQPPSQAWAKPPVQPPSQASAKPPVQPPSHAPTQPPSPAPTQPPSHAPTQPPSPAPTQPPNPAPSALPPRKFLAVQGVVYCKDCKYVGINNLLGAKPLFGAVVRLQCNNTRTPLVILTKTDKHGYFIISAPKTVTNYGSHKCKVSIVSSPLATCNIPTNLHYGLLGEFLKPFNKPPISKHPIGFDLFNVGPFAFEPSIKVPCR